MSLRKELEEGRETLRPVMKPVFKGALLLHSGAILESISESYFKRGILPEPFDFPSHIGNFREAAMATVGAYAIIGTRTWLLPLIDKSHEIFQQSAKRAAVGAFAASSAIQVIGEKFELTNSVVAPNTGDALDAAYGIGWSAVVAVGAYRMLTGLEQKYALQEQRSTPSHSDPLPIPASPEQ